MTARSGVALALRYCTALEQWATGKLRRGKRNGITELSLLVIFNRGRHLYTEGGQHVGHSHILVLAIRIMMLRSRLKIVRVY